MVVMIQVSLELRKESASRSKNDYNPQSENHLQQLEQIVLKEKKLNVENVKGELDSNKNFKQYM